MKKLIQPIAIAVLIILLFFKSCGKENQEPKIIEVEVPAQAGDFEAQEPIYTESKDSTIVKWKEIEIKVPNPINQELAAKYQKLSDSLNAAQAEAARYKMYIDAIQIKDFESYFEDEFIKLTIAGQVQGKINSIKPKYTIKPRTARKAIFPEQMVFRLLGGVEFGNNTSFNDFRYKLNIGFQNAKGNIFSVSYENWNNIDYYWIGYDLSIFSIER